MDYITTWNKCIDMGIILNPYNKIYELNIDIETLKKYIEIFNNMKDEYKKIEGINKLNTNLDLYLTKINQIINNNNKYILINNNNKNDFIVLNEKPLIYNGVLFNYSDLIILLISHRKYPPKSYTTTVKKSTIFFEISNLNTYYILKEIPIFDLNLIYQWYMNNIHIKGLYELCKHLI
jgi:hypothetical protein